MIGGMKIYASGLSNKYIAKLRGTVLRGLPPIKIELLEYQRIGSVRWGARKILARNEALRIEGALINKHMDNYIYHLGNFFTSYETDKNPRILVIYDHYSFHFGIQEAVRWYIYKRNRAMIKKCHSIMQQYRKNVRLAMTVDIINLKKMEKAESDRIVYLQNMVRRRRGKYWDVRKMALIQGVQSVHKAIKLYKENEKRNEKASKKGQGQGYQGARLFG